jgi:adenosylmethionine-8-amino-7-oxononanoate aminotransferase
MLPVVDTQVNRGDWAERDTLAVWHPFSFGEAQSLPVVRASGVWLTLADGRQLLDGIGSWWVTVFGHCEPSIVSAVQAQVSALDQVLFAGFSHPPAIQLAEALLGHFSGHFGKVFYSDDGSTAVEVALKLVLQARASKHPNLSTKPVFLALEGAYHGDTFGAMAVSARGAFTQPFESLLFDVRTIPSPAVSPIADVMTALEAVLAEPDVCGIILEPLIQGASGMRMYGPEALEAIVRRVRQSGNPIIFDEVFTGFGRTGRLFAADWLPADCQPDLLCLSKGITGGLLPLGATLVTAAIHQQFTGGRNRAFLHGHSFTANPLACAAAVAAWQLWQIPQTWERLRAIEAANQAQLQHLRALPQVVRATAQGVVLAVELRVPDAGYLSTLAPQLYDFMLQRGLLLRPLGNVLYLVPPLCISTDELQQCYCAITEAAQTFGHTEVVGPAALDMGKEGYF